MHDVTKCVRWLYCTGIHLVPMAKERTWERRGSKDIKIVGLEDKRQVTACVSSAVDGTLLPMQIIFTCIFNI